MVDLTNSQIKKAGDILRRHREGTRRGTPQELLHAYEVLERFRRQWSEPPQVLSATVMGLRSMARTLGLPSQVSQRLKRTDRIVQKLVRKKTRLNTLQDIAGCRAVVESLRDQEALVDRLVRNWAPDIDLGPQNPRNYVRSPRPTGYRAIHIVVKKNGLPVEVQVRTRRQHDWAMMVEKLEDRTGDLLKDNQGDSEVLSSLRELSHVFAEFDAGKRLDSRGIDRVHALLGRLGLT